MGKETQSKRKKTILLAGVIAVTAVVTTGIILLVSIQFQQQQPDSPVSGLADMLSTKEIQTLFSCLPDKNEEEVAGYIQMIRNTKTMNENIKTLEAQRKVIFDTNDPKLIADWNATAGEILEGYYKIRREYPDLYAAGLTLTGYSDEEINEMFMHKNENYCKEECYQRQLDYRSAACENEKLNCVCFGKVV